MLSWNDPIPPDERRSERIQMTSDPELADAIAWARRDAAIEPLAEMSTGWIGLDWDGQETARALAWGNSQRFELFTRFLASPHESFTSQ